MATVNDLIKRSLRLLKVKESGESLTADEAADGLAVLNTIVDGLNNELYMQYGRTQITHTLTASDGEYSIGSGADIDTTNPMRIESCFIRDSNNNDYWMQIINDEQYNSISLKTTETTYPRYLYHDRGWPTGTLKIWPEPASAVTLVLNVWPQLSAFTSVTQTLDLPPGYQRLYEYELAVELSPEYKIPDTMGIIQSKAVEAKADIKTLNDTETPILRSDAIPLVNRNRYDYNSGYLY